MQSAISKMQDESKTGILITWVVQIRFRNQICTTQVCFTLSKRKSVLRGWFSGVYDGTGFLWIMYNNLRKLKIA